MAKDSKPLEDLNGTGEAGCRGDEAGYRPNEAVCRGDKGAGTGRCGYLF